MQKLKKSAVETAKKLYRFLHPRQRQLQRMKAAYRELFAQTQEKLLGTDLSAQQAEALKREAFLAMPCLDEEIALLQKGNYQLLRMLKSICVEHGIQFWILGGTLLGAVRHKGFIPWDDDVDVGMLREELDRLMSVMDQYPDLRLERYYNNRPYRGKAHATQTIKLTLADRRSPFWLDILVYDWAGNSNYTEEELWGEISRVRRSVENILIKEQDRLKKVYWDEPVEIPEDRKRIDGRYSQGMEILPMVLEKAYVYRGIDSVCGAWQQLFPVERIFPLQELEFNGESYPAPKDYDWYMKLHYGDYLALPEDIGEVHTAFARGKMRFARAALEELERICGGDGENAG